MLDTFTHHPVRDGSTIVAFEVRRSQRICGAIHNGFAIVSRIECAPGDKARKIARKAAERVAKSLNREARKANRADDSDAL